MMEGAVGTYDFKNGITVSPSLFALRYAFTLSLELEKKVGIYICTHGKDFNFLEQVH
jgi:hypothetical protein